MHAPRFEPPWLRRQPAGTRRPVRIVLAFVSGSAILAGSALVLLLAGALRVPPGFAHRAQRMRVPVETAIEKTRGSGQGNPSPADAGDRDSSHACRLWALIGSGYPADLIRLHLRDGSYQNLRNLAQYNADGWGFGSFLAGTESSLLRLPLLRRGRPAANDSAEVEYSVVVDELAQLRPRAVLGHIRHGSTGHWGIPDPHPFQQERWIFAHNGNLPASVLDSLLTWDDPRYLLVHPPEYVTDWVDSELFFLYVLKVAHRSPQEFEAALCQAVREVDRVTGSIRRLNFVMTQGDTLWAVRCAYGDTNDPVVYSPHLGGGSDTSPYWAVASQALGTSSLEWAVLPPRTLGVFIPGLAPRFFSIDDTPPPAGVHSLPLSTIGSFRVGSPYPNPAAGEIAVPVSVESSPRSSGMDARIIRCDIFNAAGRRVRELEVASSARTLHWDMKDAAGRRVSSGAYALRLSAGDRVETRKVVILSER